MAKLRPFHRLFGLAWMDLFAGTPVRVEPELDMSTQQMLLDVAISIEAPLTTLLSLPDGFTRLAKYIVVTFKSYREPLDSWSLLELIHHYVSRRSQVSTEDVLLPVEEFQVIAVCVRRPYLLGHLGGVVAIQPGVYEFTVLELTIRIIVIHELPLEPQNAMLHLFSAREDAIRFGIGHYRHRSTETSALICALFKEYLKDPTMPDLLKEFARETIQDLLHSLTPEERLEGLPTEVRLEGVPAEERLKGLPMEVRLEGVPAEERLKGLPTEVRLEGVPTEERLKGVPAEERLKGVPAEERLKDVPKEELRKRLSPRERLVGMSADEVLQSLSPEELEALIQKLKANGATPHPPGD